MGSDYATQLAISRALPPYDRNRPSRAFLSRLYPRDAKWGFTIYRTVYTPGSDALFISALEKMKECIAIYLRSEYRDFCVLRTSPSRHGQPPLLPIDAGPCDQVEDQYDPLVIEDPEIWDGASIEDIRAHFRDSIVRKCMDLGNLHYGPVQDRTIPITPFGADPQSSVCLLIDAEVLEWMANTEMPDRAFYCVSEEELQTSLERRVPYLTLSQHALVKGIDADWPRHDHIWDPERNESSLLGRRNGIPDPPRPVSQYRGWRPIRCESLWDLYYGLEYGGRLGS